MARPHPQMGTVIGCLPTPTDHMCRCAVLMCVACDCVASTGSHEGPRPLCRHADLSVRARHIVIDTRTLAQATANGENVLLEGAFGLGVGPWSWTGE